MADLDRAKDFINNIRLYMTISVALIMAIGSSISKMYLNGDVDYLFFTANLLILILIVIFIYLAKVLHRKTDELKDL